MSPETLRNAPETFRPDKEGIGKEGISLKQATSKADVLAAAFGELRDRGIVNPEQFSSLEPDAILGACRWFDAQRGRVGTGVLVAELRSGGKPGWRSSRSSTEEQKAYGEAVQAWIRRHFPDLCDDGVPHPAAVAAVFRLHQRYGKGSLTAGEHGLAVRAAVERWNNQEG